MVANYSDIGTAEDFDLMAQDFDTMPDGFDEWVSEMEKEYGVTAEG